jgi:hypothetical protein
MNEDTKRMRVIDIPFGTTPDAAEHSLNEISEDYYVIAIYPGDKGGTRAFFNLRARRLSGENGRMFRGNQDGKQDEALKIIAEHVDESMSKLKQRLADAGINRSENWISKKRLPMRAKGAKYTTE